MRNILTRLEEFLFSPASDQWLAVLRLGLGLQVMLYCLSLRNDWHQMLSGAGSGFINREFTESLLTIDGPVIPRLGWVVALGSQLGLAEKTILSITWILLFCAGCGLLLGLFCRTSAITAWFIHLCAAKSGDFLTYGMDNFTTIGLFYLMLCPLPDQYSLDWRLRSWKPRRPELLGFWRRVLQVHLCFIYFFGGLTKCLGVGWWNGKSMWHALTSPPFNIIAPERIIPWKLALPLLGIAVWVLEIGYPFFIWPRKTRLIWLVAILGMHIAIGLTMGLYLFSLIMIVLNLAAFAPGIGRKQSETINLGPREAVA